MDTFETGGTIPETIPSAAPGDLGPLLSGLRDTAEAIDTNSTVDPIMNEIPLAAGSVLPTVVEQQPGFFERTHERFAHLSTRAKVGITAVALVLSGGAAFAATETPAHNSAQAASASPSSSPNAKSSASGASGVLASEACSDGVFVKGVYEASLTGKLDPQDLARPPKGDLDTKNKFLSYNFGKDGIACDSASVAGALSHYVKNLYGEGALGAIDFGGVTNANDLIRYFAGHAKIAEKAIDYMQPIFKGRASLNKEAINGAYFEIITLPPLPDGTVPVALKPVTLTKVESGNAWVLKGGTGGEGGNEGDERQRLIQDRVTGKWYVLKSAGMDVVASNPKEQDATGQAEAARNAAAAAGENNQNTGGGTGGGKKRGKKGGSTKGCGGTCGKDGGGPKGGGGGGPAPGGGGPTPGGGDKQPPPTSNPPTPKGAESIPPGGANG